MTDEQYSNIMQSLNNLHKFQIEIQNRVIAIEELFKKGTKTVLPNQPMGMTAKEKKAWEEYQARRDDILSDSQNQ